MEGTRPVIGWVNEREALHRYSGIRLYVRQHKIYMDDSGCELNIDDKCL